MLLNSNSMLDIAHDEKIIAVVRRHWFVLLLESLGVIFLFFLPFVLFGIFKTSLGQQAIELVKLPNLDPRVVIFISSLWLLMIWFRLFSTWTSYFLDKWVITNKRIVTIDQVGFFSRDVSSFRVDKIQDIETKVEGLLETFIDYGDITIKTAGEMSDFTMRDVPTPTKLKELITRQQDIVAKEFKNLKDTP